MTYDTKGQIVVCSKSEFKVTSLQGGNDMNYERARQLMAPPLFGILSTSTIFVNNSFIINYISPES